MASLAQGPGRAIGLPRGGGAGVLQRRFAALDRPAGGGPPPLPRADLDGPAGGRDHPAHGLPDARTHTAGGIDSPAGIGKACFHRGYPGGTSGPALCGLGGVGHRPWSPEIPGRPGHPHHPDDIRDDGRVPLAGHEIDVVHRALRSSWLVPDSLAGCLRSRFAHAGRSGDESVAGSDETNWTLVVCGIADQPSNRISSPIGRRGLGQLTTRRGPHRFPP